MIFIVSNPKNKQHKLFCASERVVYLDTLCLIKKVRDKNNIIIIDSININEEGIVEEFNYFFEEIVISINVGLIITNQLNNKLLDIAIFHNIPLIVL